MSPATELTVCFTFIWYSTIFTYWFLVHAIKQFLKEKQITLVWWSVANRNLRLQKTSSSLCYKTDSLHCWPVLPLLPVHWWESLRRPAGVIYQCNLHNAGCRLWYMAKRCIAVTKGYLLDAPNLLSDRGLCQVITLFNCFCRIACTEIWKLPQFRSEVNRNTSKL